MVRLARWSASRRRLVIGLWAVALLLGMGLAAGIGSRYVNDFRLPHTGSQAARDLLGRGFRPEAGDRDQVVFHARRGTLERPELRREVERVLERLAALPHVEQVTSPYAPQSHALSRDRSIGFATVLVAPSGAHASNADTHRVIAAAVSGRSSDLQVELGGPAIEQVQRTAIGSSMLVGLGAAVIVLLLSFGSLLAMGLPIVTALFGLGFGVGVVALVSRTLTMADFSSELALMVGLGVGIDYALLIVTRYREAYRANDGDVDDAVEVAMNTAGRAVIFAGATVVISLLGMLSLGIGLLNGPALASAIAVIIVLAASLTLLPALLGLGGHRIGRGGNLLGRARRPRPHGELWDRWIRAIQRRPWWAVAVASAFMLVLAAPTVGLRLGNTDAGNDPSSQTTHRAYELLAEGFGSGFNGPLLLAVRLPRANGSAALDRLAAVLRRTPDIAAVSAPQMNAAGDVAAVSVFPASSPQSERTVTLVSRLRDIILPPLERTTGTTAYVGGFTASQIDFAHVVASKLWLFIGVVVLLSAFLLLVVFRSLLIPLQAAVMNLLSIGASLGVVVAIFQHGWLHGLLGIGGGPIQAFLPVMVFAIVFGLSMDYEVFLVARIHEAWVHGSSSSEAVRLGLTRTGRVVTAAAAVMVVVFASFALSGDRTIELFGIGLATAVFLDAVVIRCLLLPAVLELLGRSTWSFPSALDRLLPRLAIEPPPSHPTAPVAWSGS
ncbi:MAG TPA: MMPL family transporter [Gaiellaceae bacterium]|nr:MMPL family transporter [Gaiellaceae bacterium]